MSNEIITSLVNSKIKNVLKLQKFSERKNQNLIVIEGMRELGLAVGAGFKIETLFFCKEASTISLNEVINKLAISEKVVFEVNKAVFAKMAYREDSDGIIALAQPKQLKLNDLKLAKNSLIIILEAVEKPGNLGAVLRTADAANADAVIVCDERTDFYNPNVIRSSVGCVFTTQVVASTTEDVYSFLKEKNIKSYAALLSDSSKPYHHFDYTKPTAFVMGTEAVGLTEKWQKVANEHVIIPMSGKIDSLNVSNATAILTFEAKRQRDFK